MYKKHSTIVGQLRETNNKSLHKSSQLLYRGLATDLDPANLATMRLNIQTLALFCIASTTATPITTTTLNTRDITIVQTAITSIIDALTTFDTSVNALTPSVSVPSVIGDITTTGAGITSALDTGTTNVQSSAPLTVPDTINLVTPAQNLGNTANSTLNDLIAKHDILANAGEAPTIVSLLETMKASSGLFVAAIVAKVPSALQGPVQSVSCEVTDAFNRGITAFGGTVNGTACI
jgi:hypothetical protein